MLRLAALSVGTKSFSLCVSGQIKKHLTVFFHLWVSDIYPECDTVPINSQPLILHCVKVDKAILRHRLQRLSKQRHNLTS
jgi:hypothetical protein